jgi:hypothetical protein
MAPARATAPALSEKHDSSGKCLPGRIDTRQRPPFCGHYPFAACGLDQASGVRQACRTGAPCKAALPGRVRLDEHIRPVVRLPHDGRRHQHRLLAAAPDRSVRPAALPPAVARLHGWLVARASSGGGLPPRPGRSLAHQSRILAGLSAGRRPAVVAVDRSRRQHPETVRSRRRRRPVRSTRLCSPDNEQPGDGDPFPTRDRQRTQPTRNPSDAPLPDGRPARPSSALPAETSTSFWSSVKSWLWGG